MGLPDREGALHRRGGGPEQAGPLDRVQVVRHRIGGVQESGQQALTELGHEWSSVRVVDEVAELGRIVPQVVQLVAFVRPTRRGSRLA